MVVHRAIVTISLFECMRRCMLGHMAWSITFMSLEKSGGRLLAFICFDCLKYLINDLRNYGVSVGFDGLVPPL